MDDDICHRISSRKCGRIVTVSHNDEHHLRGGLHQSSQCPDFRNAISHSIHDALLSNVTSSKETTETTLNYCTNPKRSLKMEVLVGFF